MKLLTNLSICFLTLSILLLFVYFRLTKKITVILLNDNNIMQYYYYFLYLGVISLSIFFLLCVLLLWKAKLQKTAPGEPSQYLLKFVLWYKKINIFYKTYDILFGYFSPNYTQYLITVTKTFLSWPNTRHRNLILIFVTLPRMLIVLVLFFEIYHKNLHYYFYSLVLLFIPLIFKFFVFILQDIGPRLLPELNKFMVWDHSNNQEFSINSKDGLKTVKAVGIQFKPEYADKDLDHFLENYYYPILYIEPEMTANFNPKYSKITIITLLIYLGLHAVGWGYILLFL